MEIETKVSVKSTNGNIVSADVLLYNDWGNVVKKMTIIESEVLRSLQDTISGYESDYISINELETILENASENIEINATKFAGLRSDEVALKDEIPTSFDPIAHDSDNSKYGVGSKTRYGHVKLRDNLSATNYSNGEALSSYQGAILNKMILDEITEHNLLKSQYYGNSLKIKFGRERDSQGENGSRIYINKGERIYMKLYCDNPEVSLENRTVQMVINGVPYERTTSSEGKAFLQINLNLGKYLLTGIASGGSGVNSTSEQTIIIVQ